MSMSNGRWAFCGGLLGFGDLARPDTARADAHLYRLTLSDRLHVLQIRIPAFLGLIVGMADVIAHHGALAAYFAYFGHGKSPLKK
jgi:hypothetical protein